ncbi:AbiTii domain-containing protein [Aeromonas caviae]|uniref:AbiTii domain-containing protein n=1 Tax=Aeromonas caviae TaxID=648 RepID=UPI000693DD81|nr:hypothetical protein [Aeromonas caviae]MBS4635915.1 hypothetical protein [Aeromonas caviae]WQD89970.1 hypothetical protein U0022_04445 [Aeromonas caviae]SQH58465.1 Uncharacterised protein [Aeromonas caviae]
MPDLIPELIVMASDPTVKTPDLLRRALVAARRLKLHEWVKWIGYELRGYPNEQELPPYREVSVPLMGQDNLGQLWPITNPALWNLGKYQSVAIKQPIGEIEAWAIGGMDIKLRFPDRVEQQLLDCIGHAALPVRVLTIGSISSILDMVRNEVLEWSLALEAEGILGEEMSFTTQEQDQAKQLAPVTIHIEGGIHGGQLMVSSPGSQQQQTVTSEQKVEALEALLPWLQQVIEQGQLQKDACGELQAELATLQAQAASPKPKWPVIGAVAGSVRAILEGASGGVLAAEALGWLATLATS